MQFPLQRKKEEKKKNKVIKWITTLFLTFAARWKLNFGQKLKTNHRKHHLKKADAKTEVSKQLQLLNPKTYLAGSHKACMTSNLFLSVLTVLFIYFLLTQGMQSFT